MPQVCTGGSGSTVETPLQHKGRCSKALTGKGTLRCSLGRCVGLDLEYRSKRVFTHRGKNGTSVMRKRLEIREMRVTSVQRREWTDLNTSWDPFSESGRKEGEETEMEHNLGVSSTFAGGGGVGYGNSHGIPSIFPGKKNCPWKTEVVRQRVQEEYSTRSSIFLK